MPDFKYYRATISVKTEQGGIHKAVFVSPLGTLEQALFDYAYLHGPAGLKNRLNRLLACRGLEVVSVPNGED